MSDMCDYLENKLIDHVLRNIPYTPPVTVYVALLTADPGEEGDTTNEVADGGYIRQAATFGTPVDGLAQNTYDIEFPQAQVDWNTISHVLLMDAEAGGNPLFHKILSSTIEDEPFTSDYDVAVPLDHENIIENSQVVTSDDGLTQYYEGRDYTINNANGTITILSTGLMADATSYLISYDYKNPKTITANDIFKIPIGSLKVSYK